jgi:hypothetical protein
MDGWTFACGLRSIGWFFTNVVEKECAVTEHEHDAGVERMDAKTVEALYELVKDVPERQIDGGAALDTKMVQILSAASIVIGLTALSFSGASAPGGVAVTTLLVMAMMAYVATAYVAFQHLRPKRYKRLKYDSIWRYCWALKPDQAQHTVITKATEAFNHNAPILEGKSYTIRAVLITLGSEVVLVALALISARVG